jgi:outer membrane lipoprotein SlyB
MAWVTRSVLSGIALAALASSSAFAQQPQGQRVRGTIEKVDGNTLSVKARDGATLAVALTSNVQVVGVVKASLADIKEGSYIGSGAMPQADGSQKAVEVHIFAESQRGTGDGHRPWAGAPNGTMTNGSVATTVSGVDGPTITIKYKDGEKKLIVPPGTPIVRYELGEKSELKPGASITILNAVKKPDGTFEAARINVGRDGVVPQ